MPALSRLYVRPLASLACFLTVLFSPTRAATATTESAPATLSTSPGGPALSSPPPLADDPAGRELLATAQHAIAAYHDGHRNAPSLLRVVYFHPSDRDPLPNYAERLDRIMTDVSNFYRDGLARFGIENQSLPLERKDGRLVLHVVRGRHPASGYRYDDGETPAREIRAALKGVVDMDREHVLVIHGLCRKEPDGRYVFHAPYYGAGWSSQRAGLCHAADCELLDPLLLTETKRKIVYTEHYYPRVEQTLARYNSWYLGGIAHELGHALGLVHDAGNPGEQGWGTSLMGEGNHTYRQERWGGGMPTFLSRGSALCLAAHPLFTRSNQGRWHRTRDTLAGLKFSNADGTLRIRGKARGEIASYAVIAYVFSVNSWSDHSARTYPVAVKGGSFDLLIGDLRPGNYHLRLATLYVNGSASRRYWRFAVDAKGQPDANALNLLWSLERAPRSHRARRVG